MIYYVCDVIEHPLPNMATYETMIPKTQNRTPTAQYSNLRNDDTPKKANPNAKVRGIVNHASVQKAYSEKSIESRSSAQSLAYSKHNL